MIRLRRLAAVLVAACSVGASDDSAQSVVDRTSTTTATYAVYSWGGAVDAEGKEDGGWSAEFHAADWHRMEGPSARVVANCKTHVGFYYDIASGTTTDAPNAFKGSCGVFDPGDVIEVAKLSVADARRRRLDVVQVTDPRFKRLYAIDARGAIVESSWTAANGSPAPCIWTRAFNVEDRLPVAEMFTRESLARSMVPAKYREQPSVKASDYLFVSKCGTRQQP